MSRGTATCASWICAPSRPHLPLSSCCCARHPHPSSASSASSAALRGLLSASSSSSLSSSSSRISAPALRGLFSASSSSSSSSTRIAAPALRGLLSASTSSSFSRISTSAVRGFLSSSSSRISASALRDLLSASSSPSCSSTRISASALSGLLSDYSSSSAAAAALLRGRANFADLGCFSSRHSSARKSFVSRGVESKAGSGGLEEDSERDPETELGVEGGEEGFVERRLLEEKRRANPRGRAETSVVATMVEVLDLEKQFSFYGAYHSNKVNVWIHIFFVWPIFYTSLILWAYTPALAPLPLAAGTLPLQDYMVLNWSFVQAAIYAGYYIALDKKAGSLAALICLGCWIGANAVAQALPWSLSWKIVLASQVTCWFFQIFGHQKFEGRAPALLDNLPQAFLMAPFFVLLECLQVFGYEPYPGFHKKVQKNVDDAIREFRQSKAKKAA